MKPTINNSISWLTIVYFFATVGLMTLYAIERADNHYLEQRYYQCSGKYY